MDPACGSGAFLLQAFDILINQGKEINSKILKLSTTKIVRGGDTFASLNAFLLKWEKDILINKRE